MTPEKPSRSAEPYLLLAHYAPPDDDPENFELGTDS